MQVRKWDAVTGTNVDTFNDRKAVSCVAVPRGGSELVAFAGAAKALHLWDPRRRQAEDAVSPSLVVKTRSPLVHVSERGLGFRVPPPVWSPSSIPG